ncbi:MAG: hypothetical protein IPI30_19425 [Saprospiraceae bacterium]|nr:hypothetical protein [Candidatus Vicinibacter affinis]
MENNPYSYHLFLFPFQWDYIPGGKLKKDVDFETRTKLDICEQQFEPTLWKRNPFTIGEETDAHTDYNEFTFFYDFVRKSIFDYEDVHDENDRLRYFQYNRQNIGTYSITARAGDNPSTIYTLNIISISLHLYNTGVGILTYNLKNMDYPDPEAVLRINEFGRRIYPQFLGKNFTTETKNAFLPDKIEVDFKDGRDSSVETFSYFNDQTNLQRSSTKLPKHIMHLFDETLFTDQDKEDERILITNIMDDRMFTLCWYGNNQISRELKTNNSDLKNYAYAKSEWWYKYIFCDKDWPSCQNEYLLQDSLEAHTYARWASYGTYFGITRETFMLLTSDISQLTNFKAPPLYDHLRTIYFQIVVLCLISRSSLLRFSGEVARLGDLANHHKLSEKQFFKPIEK